MNKEKLKSAIMSFVKNKKANAAYYDDNWKERMERRAFYQSFTRDKILGMTEEDFLEFMSKLWSMLIWGNKKYVVDKMIADNGFDNEKAIGRAALWQRFHRKTLELFFEVC